MKNFNKKETKNKEDKQEQRKQFLKYALMGFLTSFLACVAFALIMTLNKNFIIESFGGVTLDQLSKITETKRENSIEIKPKGKMVTSPDGEVETEFLLYNLEVLEHQENAIIDIRAFARGKYKHLDKIKKTGIVEIKIQIDEIVYAMDSSYINKCEYKNDKKVLSSSTSYLTHLRKGNHQVTVEGIYKGSIVAFSTEAVIKLEWDKETTLRELYEEKTKRSK